MFFIIYKTTNQIDGKYYIGAHQTFDIDDGYMGSGKYLKRAINKYGIENFTKEILHFCNNADEMYEKEKQIVNEDIVKNSNTYNIKMGGSGGWDHIDFKGKPRSESFKRKLRGPRPQITGANNHFYGKKHSKETLDIITANSRKNSKRVYEQRMKVGNHPNNSVECPHCNKVGQYRAMKRWHFDNCNERENNDRQD